MARFLPLFDTTGVLPAWCGAASTDGVVYIADSDYKDQTSEHFGLHVAQWFGSVVQAGEGSAGQSFTVPHLVAVSNGRSAPSRHTPSCGMPPFIANCILTRTRLPVAWWTDFIHDARRGPNSVLFRRFAEDIHDPKNHNFTYQRRRMAEQQDFPYGIDEFMLTVVVKQRSLALPADQAQSWLFVLVPGIDMLMMKAVDMINKAVEADPEAATDPRVLAVLRATAKASGSDEASVCAAVMDAKARSGWHQHWPEKTAGRAGLSGTFPGRFDAVFSPSSAALATDMASLHRAQLEALGSGTLPHKTADMDQIAWSADMTTQLAPDVVGSLLFTVGGGRAVNQGLSTAVGRAVLEHVRGAESCAVPLPPRQPKAQGGQHAGPQQWASVPNLLINAPWITGGMFSPLPPMPSDPPPYLGGPGLPHGGAGAAVAHPGPGYQATPQPMPVAGVKRPREDDSGGYDDDDDDDDRNLHYDSGPACAGSAAPAPTPTPAPVQAAPAAVPTAAIPPEWQLRTSRSSGMQYYSNSRTGQSLWHEASLPVGWAFTRDGPTGPKVYVHLATGERTNEAPV